MLYRGVVIIIISSNSEIYINLYQIKQIKENMDDLPKNYIDNYSEDYIVAEGDLNLRCDYYWNYVVIDDELEYASEKMEIKDALTCDNEVSYLKVICEKK